MHAETGGVAVHRVDRLTLSGPVHGVAWPHLIGVLPQQAECFQYRSVADTLDEVLAEHGTAVLCQVLAGTGGVGKTQLAADHARRAWHQNSVDLLMWVTATSRQAIQTAYTQGAVEVIGAEPDDLEQASARFLAWLETTGRRWLIVLDDLVDPADIRGLWPPRHPGGRVLITTRRRDAALRGRDRQLIDVGLFTPAEATAYLQAKLAAHGRENEPQQIAALARDLGYLPLALAQAAAYLVDLDLDCAGYRRRLADRRRTLTDLVPDRGSLPDDHHATLAAAWALSVEQADRLRPAGLARPMLELTSMLDPNGIPMNVLTSRPALDYLSVGRARLGSQAAGDLPEPGTEDAVDALSCLNRLSLADVGHGTRHRKVRVHSLTQRATRESLPAGLRRGLVRAAADALLAAWPAVENDAPLVQALRANTEALHTNAEDVLWESGAHPVLFRSGSSLGEAGLLAPAVDYWQRMHTIARDRLGPDHPDTLATRGHIAHWEGEHGDAKGAAAAFEALLADSVRLVGPYHPDTLALRGNVLYWRRQAGTRWLSAIVSAAEGLLADRLRVLGPDHPDTLATRCNIAYWRGELGDAEGAAAAFETVLADSERLLGPDHPDTLVVRGNLAYWRRQAGGAVAAIADSAEKVLAARLRVLGPDHPATLASRAETAYWRGHSGDPAGAVAAFERLLSDRVRVLGPDHPETTITRGNLAHWKGEAGDPAGAAAAFEELLADSHRMFGPDHPDTQAVRRSLAHWRQRAQWEAGHGVSGGP